MLKFINRALAVLLIQLICISPLLAQQKRRTTPPRKPAAVEAAEPVPTFDSLLASGSYKVYSEVRNVGGLIHSPAANELIESLTKIGGPPKEFKSVVKWLHAHADSLVGSRMMAASWPSRPNLPTVLVAVELSSPEEAKKFFPDLKNVLPTIFPTPTPTPATSSSPDGTTASRVAPATATVAEAPPYQLKQLGSLVLVSSTPIDLRVLRPRGSLALEEDPNFVDARNRFASEPVFVFFDMKALEAEEKAQRQKWEEEAKQRAEAEAARVKEEAPPTPVEEPVPLPTLELTPETETGELKAEQPPTATLSAGPPPDALPSIGMLFSMLGRGPAKWPDAIAAALELEGDAYVVRALVINKAEDKNTVVPFMPLLMSGPPIAPAAANVFPANTDLFVSLSLDYSQVYEELLKTTATIARNDALGRRAAGLPAQEDSPENPFALYEKKLGLKIKDDLLPLLGNEIALALPRAPAKAPAETASPAPSTNEAKPVRPPEPTPVIAIAIKDREAVKRFIPRLLEGFGMKAANLIAQTEKRDATELVSYAGLFAYAFIEDFLIVSPEVSETRRVVDAYVNHQTLASDNNYKNFTRWQPRAVVGQVYVAQGIVDSYFFGGPAGANNEQLTELMHGINPVVDPMTYALLTEGPDTTHELHVPKNLVQFLVAAASSSSSSSSPLQSNENMASSALYSIAYGQQNCKSESGAYVPLEQLVTKSWVSKDMIENHGYTFLVSISGNSFEAIAVPIEYGKTGRLSFFIDESMIMRAGDHGGGAATASDNPIGQPFSR